MNSSKVSSLLFTLSLIFISQASGAALYQEVCKATEEDNVGCLQVLKAEPRIASAADDFELCKLILEFALKKGIEAQNYIKEVSKSSPSEAMEQCASFCYDGVVASFKSSLSELNVDTQTANYDAKTAGDGPTTCDNALATANINNPTISAINKEIMLLSKIAFYATNRLPETESNE